MIVSQEAINTSEVRVSRSSPVASDRLLDRPAESGSKDAGTTVTSMGKRTIDRVKLGVLTTSPTDHESDSTKAVTERSPKRTTKAPKVLQSILQVQLLVNVQEGIDSSASQHLDILA